MGGIISVLSDEERKPLAQTARVIDKASTSPSNLTVE